MRRASVVMFCVLLGACIGHDAPSMSERRDKRAECAGLDDFDDKATDKAFGKFESSACKQGFLGSCERWFTFVVATCGYDHGGDESFAIHINVSPLRPSSYVDERNQICDKARLLISRTAKIELVDTKGRVVTTCGNRKKK